MKKLLAAGLCLILATGCGWRDKAEEAAPLRNYTRRDLGEVSALVYEGREYIPFCVVSKADRGVLLGYVDGDRDEQVHAYLDLPPEQWIVSSLTMDGGAILMKERSVTDIPEGLTAEYPQI